MINDYSKYFYSKSEDNTLHSRITIPDKHINIAIENKEKLLKYIKEKLKEELDFEVKTWIQGSYKSATLIRSHKIDEKFDIDVGIYVFFNAEEEGYESHELKALLRDILIEYSNIEIATKVEKSKSKCERVSFSKLFHIDLPLYYYDDELDKLKLATSDGWIDSDPKQLQDWFYNKAKGFSDEDKAKLKRIIRYIKIWTALKWDNESFKISSLAINILVYNNFINSDNEADTFIDTVFAINEELQDKFEVLNPLTNENVLEFSSEQIKVSKIKWNLLSKTCERIRKGSLTSSTFWSLIFEHFFPIVIEEPKFDTVSNLPTLTNPPNISFKHLNSKGEVISNKISNSIIAFKNERFSFQLSNQEEYSNDCKVFWIIKNQGDIANNVNDLGHIKVLDLNDVLEEHCAYKGIHLIECQVINQYSQVEGYCSIKININGFIRPKKNPAKKKYGAK
ncbi:nucleotidyltransferase [Arcobacter ellisii]|uniref:Cyclic GMP-AMP synthase n=1 Tax=Arcobacter ellisii TaxID=913109 RepID=A0A347U805_9BACT|nr:nucleotidyltransferase [Arcobacter ellisii]AXX94983.1 hypothetical protein AELL_1320 [Arcobacter ellisii]RXI30307.1 hypothetical protein CP962_08135 [Arcobacter ellisii]